MEDKFLEVCLRFKITADDVDIIMMNALDGSISHWCRRVKPDGELMGIGIAEQISSGGELLLLDNIAKRELRLNLSKMLIGIKLWAKKSIGHSCLTQTDGIFVIDPLKVDSAISDAIIQYALFGDVLYA